MSDKFAGANLDDRRSARRVPARDRPAQKAPQATFSNQLVNHQFVARRRGAQQRRRSRVRFDLLPQPVHQLLQQLAIATAAMPPDLHQQAVGAHRVPRVGQQQAKLYADCLEFPDRRPPA